MSDDKGTLKETERVQTGPGGPGRHRARSSGSA